MKFTIGWLKEHLDTQKKDNELIEKLTDIGLEVESFENLSSGLDSFKVAKIINAEQHPNADRLRICDVDIGLDNTVKVVCGAPNAKKDLLTIYAGPGSIIPKNNMKLSVSKIRGVTSYGMLCSESELNLSNESEGITELPTGKYSDKIGKNFFNSKTEKVVDLSITPNRPDCLGVRGIARDLAAAGVGKLKKISPKNIKKNGSQKIKVSITKDKNQGCTVFGSCLIEGVTNKESPQWLKEKIISLGQKPISAIVDITNYVMLDLNRPLHAYDADKIDKEIIVRNSKKGETFKALDNKEYKLDDGMCVISDHQGVLGLGGIIGGIRSGTELYTKNILLESAYFDPEITRKTAKKLDLNSDAKFRFERGIDPNSISSGLEKASEMIVKICGGEVSKLDIQSTKNITSKKILFDPQLASKVIGIQIKITEIIIILQKLGFVIKKKGKLLSVNVPTWRPDIHGQIDLVEEIIRIKGFDKIQSVEPEKRRLKPTLDFFQRHFHLAQRSVASKGYLEVITWSFTDEKINESFKENLHKIKIINPISSELNVLRNSLYPNLIYFLKKNIDRGFDNQSLFEIGPSFIGKKPGEQITIVCGLKKEDHINVFDIKKDVVQTLVELGINKDETTIDVKTPGYYHPGNSGSIITKKDKKLIAYFGEIHPKIINKTYGFEIFLENLVNYKKLNKKNKPTITFSDYQKSDRDYAFVVEKDFKAQDLIEIISSVDKSLIKNVKIFDVYEGENISSDKKSIALKVTIQSDNKTLNEKDLNEISQKIISSVEVKAGAKLRS